MFDGNLFSTKILQYRKDRSMTQEGLAREIGVTAQAVSKWENGESMPDISILPDLAKVFGVSLDTLLDVPYIDNLDRFDKQAKIARRAIKDNGNTVKTCWGMFKAVFQACFHDLIKSGSGESHYCINDDLRKDTTARWDDDGLCFIMRNSFLNSRKMDTKKALSLLSILNESNLEVLKQLSITPISFSELVDKTNCSPEPLQGILMDLMENEFVQVYNGGYSLSGHVPVAMLLASLISMTKMANHTNRTF